MKVFFGLLLNIVYLWAIWAANNDVSIADNLLNVLNSLVIFLTGIMLFCIVGIIYQGRVDPETALKVVNKNGFDTYWFRVRNITYYICMFILTTWYGMWGTLVINIIAGISLVTWCVTMNLVKDIITETKLNKGI